MKIAIFGAGFTGLTAALRLVKLGHKVTLFEKEGFVGGLASGFRLSNWEWYLDYHYHHLFTSDNFAINLLKEIGVSEDLIFTRPKTAIYYKQPFGFAQGKQAISNKQQDNSYRHSDENQKLFKWIPAPDCAKATTGRQGRNDNFLYKFDSPFDLLRFPHLSLFDKLRTGIVLAFLKFIPFGLSLEKATAYEWLPKYMGLKAFKVLWEPLFIGKFGKEAKNISMAWFWARIYKRSPSLGYIKGGFQNFAEKIKQKIVENGGKVLLNCSVIQIEANNVIPAKAGISSSPVIPAKAGIYINNDKQIKIHYQYNNKQKVAYFDKVICTLPTSAFLKITPNLPSDYIDKLNNIRHLDCLNLILVFKEKFFPDSTYWLNINEVSIPFLALVEHTNFMDNKYYGGEHLVYAGNYLSPDHEFFQKSKEELLAIFDPYLAKFNPDYKKILIGSHLYRGNEAQPIIPINYSKLIPDFITPIDNLYLANMDMVYPWDRGVNYAIELGEKIATQISTKRISN